MKKKFFKKEREIERKRKREEEEERNMLGSLFEQDDGDFPIFVEDDVALNHPDASSMKGKKKVIRRKQ